MNIQVKYGVGHNSSTGEPMWLSVAEIKGKKYAHGMLFRRMDKDQYMFTAARDFTHQCNLLKIKNVRVKMREDVDIMSNFKKYENEQKIKT